MRAMEERIPVKIKLKSRQTLGYQMWAGLLPTDMSSVLRNLYLDEPDDFDLDLFEREHFDPEFFPQETDEALDSVLDLEGTDIGLSLPETNEAFMTDDEEEEPEHDPIDKLKDILNQIRINLESETDDSEEFTYITTGFIGRGELDSGEKYTEVSFAENESLDGTLTVIRFFSGEKPKTVINHSGPVASVLECTEGRRYRNSYNTQFGPMEFAMYTRRCRGDIEYPTGGKLELDYFVEFKGLDAQRTRIELEVMHI